VFRFISHLEQVLILLLINKNAWTINFFYLFLDEMIGARQYEGQKIHGGRVANTFGWNAGGHGFAPQPQRHL